MMRVALSISFLVLSSQQVLAQTPMLDLADTAITTDPPAMANPSQDFCINVMSGFASDDTVARYQFFRLTEEMAVDATPEFNLALEAYADGTVDETTPVLDVIENIANPVLRQAAPEIIVGSMDHLIDFAQRCRPFLQGQISSLTAYDASLRNADTVIMEDALFLRQVLSDSLSRLGADSDAVHAMAVQNYANSLVVMRDVIEFEAFATNIEDLENLYMVDLDGRLARSNDMINSEMDREVLGDAVTLTKDMNEDLRQKDKERSVYTLFRILSRY